ncbi:predicted protein [Sclerotinia sclerotiorum 1980 UF-70]|uniref:Uncharacterized protein n=1 Tax=Sclerotinia sclerotiorum (strain ATCC 18683 / 1980 / Ss-1) TaxID=665079 RepID=A7EKB6_SCLS1|nr:predicted protein [Sclerotinia sclerotiorum 1980 UF-70]EDO03282.1 predicted protein [Sclerotinia sclerotiorum 1980 UF-70]
MPKQANTFRNQPSTFCTERQLKATIYCSFLAECNIQRPCPAGWNSGLKHKEVEHYAMRSHWRRYLVDKSLTVILVSSALRLELVLALSIGFRLVILQRMREYRMGKRQCAYNTGERWSSKTYLNPEI